MRAAPARDLLCVGNAVADCLARPVGALPPRGQLRYVDAIGLFGGGCALNTAIAAATLGLRVSVATAVGRDPFGDFMVRRMAGAGVDVTPVLRDPRRQSSATVVTVSADGERSFLHTLGASAAITDRIVSDRVLARHRHLHLSGFYLMPALDGAPARRLLARASRLGVSTSLDTCWDPRGRWHLVRMCLPFVDYYLPSYEEAREVFRSSDPLTIARAALARGVRKAVILKRGDRGCFALTREGAILESPAFRVKVVDTTGAGDVCDAGILTGLRRGLPLARALALGCAAGACSVAGAGGQGVLASLTQVRRIAARGRTRPG